MDYSDFLTIRTAELDNVPLVWYGWYRSYREVLGILVTVGRHEEALLLAEASLKVRVDSKQKDQDHQYRQQMQSVVLAIALATRQHDRAYPILKGIQRTQIREFLPYLGQN